MAAIVTQLALHHLPDAWKLVALGRLAAFMRPRGKLFLSDVVLDEEMARDSTAYIEGFLSQIPEESRESMVRHVRDEFSTFDWAMREILRRAGFILEEADNSSHFLAHYLCRKA